MSGESKNMSEVSEVQQDRETRLRHQFQSHWDRREQLHEQDLTELRQRFDKHIQTERTQKGELERELNDLRWIHARQCEMILAANEDKQELRNQVRSAREELARVNREFMALRQDAEVVQQNLSFALRRESAT